MWILVAQSPICKHSSKLVVTRSVLLSGPAVMSGMFVPFLNRSLLSYFFLKIVELFGSTNSPLRNCSNQIKAAAELRVSVPNQG